MYVVWPPHILLLLSSGPPLKKFDYLCGLEEPCNVHVSIRTIINVQARRGTIYKCSSASAGKIANKIHARRRSNTACVVFLLPNDQIFSKIILEGDVFPAISQALGRKIRFFRKKKKPHVIAMFTSPFRFLKSVGD